jgi:RNA polymerase sigma-70 factor, ECF subfamily
MDAIELYKNEKELFQFLFSIAYKFTSHVMDSEDIVQDVLQVWHQTDQSTIENKKAYLASCIKNRCFATLKKQQKEKEAYIGPNLPYPLLENNHLAVDNRHDLSFGFLILLSSLSPLERAVFILKESFDFDYAELASVFEIKEDYCRQIIHRAKERTARARPRFPIDYTQQKSLARLFTKAVETGNTEQLIHFFKEDILLVSDGGGKVPAATNPISGREPVMKFITAIYNKFYRNNNYFRSYAIINNCPAIIVFDRTTKQPITVLLLQWKGQEIENIYILRNPEKIIQQAVTTHAPSYSL